jgi:hypothetical protein
MTFLTFTPLRYLILAVRFLMVAVGATAIGILLFSLFATTETGTPQQLRHLQAVPHLFAAPSESYEKIGQGMLSTNRSAESLTLPNLSHEFVFYGYNDRPDADKSHPILFLGTRGSEKVEAILPQSKIYLSRDTTEGKNCYVIGKERIPGAICFQATAKEKQVLLQLSIDGEKTRTAEFTLTQETRPLAWKTWEIGPYKVDGGLLAKQKSRWAGPDLFLEKHGGQQFESLNGKQRIDFEEKDKAFSCFVQEGDCLVWGNERWENAVPGEQTQSRSLLQVKRIDDRLMQLCLWSPDGMYKSNLSLIKLQDPIEPGKNMNVFKYLGAKSWNEWIFEVNGSRQTLKTQDWWLREQKGWKKLASKDDILSYVHLKTRGELFVVEKVILKERLKYLSGHVFNAARTKVVAVEIPIKMHKSEAAKPVDTPPAETKAAEETLSPRDREVKQADLEKQHPPEARLKLPAAIRGHT